eukprot:2194411-Karenia_brevis.AAC.1
MRLPGPLSGFGISLPLDYADAVFIATWQAVSDRVAHVAKALDRPTICQVDEEEYGNAVRRLQALGLEVSRVGDVCFTDSARD